MESAPIAFIYCPCCYEVKRKEEFSDSKLKCLECNPMPIMFPIVMLQEYNEIYSS